MWHGMAVCFARRRQNEGRAARGQTAGKDVNWCCVVEERVGRRVEGTAKHGRGRGGEKFVWVWRG